MDLSLNTLTGSGPDLLSLFGLYDVGPSDQLTFYLLDHVLGGGSHTCGN